MNTPIDFTKMSPAELKAKLDEIDAQIAAKRDNELKTLVNGWQMKAKQNGFTIEEVIGEFKHYLRRPARNESASRSETIEVHQPVSKDREGNLPELGTTYLHPTTGEAWTKSGGRARNSFLALIQAGRTWAELKQS